MEGLRIAEEEKPEPLPPSEGQEMSEKEVEKVLRIAMAWGEDFWSEELTRLEKAYLWGTPVWDKNPRLPDIKKDLPTLVLFHDKTRGNPRPGFKDEPVQEGERHSNRDGPFFLFKENKMYIDPRAMANFYKEMLNGGRLTPLIAAYIVLHEYGHWVQKKLRIVDVDLGPKQSPKEQEIINNRDETQADFLAGAALHAVHKKKGMLEPGDIEELVRFIGTSFKVPPMVKVLTKTMEIMGHPAMAHSNPAERANSLREGLETGDWVGRLLKDTNDDRLKKRLEYLWRMDKDMPQKEHSRP